MQSADILTLQHQLVWATFMVSVLLGALVQKSHFCTMGALADWINFGDTTRLRQWSLAAGLSVLGFSLLVVTAQINPGKILYQANRLNWASLAVGGLMFGFGMVLASGCANKTLVRMGGGSLKSAVVFGVMSVTAFATLKGVFAVLRVATVDKWAMEFDQGILLPAYWVSTTGYTSNQAWLMMGLLFGGGLIAWSCADRHFARSSGVFTGLGVALLVTAMWWITGHWGHLLEHPDTLEEAFVATSSGRAEALSFVAPGAYTLDLLLFFSDQSKLVTVGIASVLGVVVGSFTVARLGHTFKWEGFAGVEDLSNHLVGGALMGIGGVTAMGCTFGQGLSALSALSLSSFIAMPAIAAGVWLALQYQMRRLG